MRAHLRGGVTERARGSRVLRCRCAERGEGQGGERGGEAERCRSLPVPEARVPVRGAPEDSRKLRLLLLLGPPCDAANGCGAPEDAALPALCGGGGLPRVAAPGVVKPSAGVPCVCCASEEEGAGAGGRVALSGRGAAVKAAGSERTLESTCGKKGVHFYVST